MQCAVKRKYQAPDPEEGHRREDAVIRLQVAPVIEVVRMTYNAAVCVDGTLGVGSATRAINDREWVSWAHAMLHGI